MTLEGEYYINISNHPSNKWGESRNPHDIGRRILLMIRRSLQRFATVAILMTLEGEYYAVSAIITELKHL